MRKFLCRKITVRFKLNLKTDGPDYKMIFKFGKRVERFHSCSKQGRRIYNVCICKQCRRIYICLFCVAKYLLGTPKPLNCTVPIQAARWHHCIELDARSCFMNGNYRTHSIVDRIVDVRTDNCKNKNFNS